MSSMRVRSKTGCLTCKNRRKKCDEKHPICDRCVRAGIECLGYSYLDLPKDKSIRPRTKPAPRTSPVPAGPSRQRSRNITAATASSSFLPATPSAWNNLSQEGSTPTLWPSAHDSFPSIFPDANADTIPNDVLDFSFFPDSTPSTLFDPHDGANGWWETNLAPVPSVNQPDQTPNFTPDMFSNQLPLTPAPTPGSTSHSSAPFCGLDPPPNNSAPPSTSATRLTNGQASLLQSLLSLGQPHELPLAPSRSICATPSSSRGSSWPSPDVECEEESSATSEESDPEGVVEIFRAPALDSNVESNSLPFVLQSYAKWISQTVFEPLRMAHQAREWVTRRYVDSEDSRHTITLVANVVRALTSRTSLQDSYLPSLSMLRTRVLTSLAVTRSTPNPSRELDMREASDALDNTIEMIAIQCMTSPLASSIRLMQDAAPIFRRACPESPDVPIHLPAKLLHPEIHIRHYVAVDVMLSTCTCRPMLFRYDVTYTPELCATVTDADDIGLQWLHGIPDLFILLLARMNMLRDDFAPKVDPQIINELEQEVKGFRSIPGVSSNPSLVVARLMVQECWRQAVYIYLYMGLCGANTTDPRVEKAVKLFMKLLEGTKPGRTPDAFLILPMIMVGVGCQRLRDRDLIINRMLNIRECAQPGTAGNESVRTLKEIWARANAEGRPAVWSDLRIATLRISGL